MDELKNIIYENLYSRTNDIKKHLDKANGFYQNREFLNCALELKKIKENCEFDELLLNIYSCVDSER